MLTSPKLQNHLRHRVVLILALNAFIIMVITVVPTRRASAQETASWSLTGKLNRARRGQTATLLPNGKVLVVGGFTDVDFFPDPTQVTAEVYDPATGTWTNTGNPKTGHIWHTATLLPNGKVLVAGPANAELYDPETGTWSLTGELKAVHSGHTATLLQDGRVLIAGGGFPGLTARSSAELYDPASGTWSVTGSLNLSRSNHTATLLRNGKVLVAGGYTCLTAACAVPSSAELYDPTSGTWSFTGNLNVARYNHTATLLPDGTVLVAGYYNDQIGGIINNSAELYDPVKGTWSNTGNLNDGRGLHTASLLPNGKVLVAAGLGDESELKSAELYNPATGTWTRTADLNEARDSHSAILLLNGKVLVVAGGEVFSGSSTAELYDPGISSSPNQIDDTLFFVRQHYRDFLNREADPDGLNFWAGEIFMCGLDPQCIEAKRINDSASFFLSIEFQESGYLVYRFHKSAFGNLPGAPVPIKLADFLADDQQLGRGVIVNQAGWQTVLENNKQAYADAFVQRSQFISLFPTSISPATFVDTLFANAGVAPTSADRTAAIGEFGAAPNTTDVGARGRALRRIAENATLAQQEFNRAFVLMQYFGYLRRNPNDAPDGSFDGYNFWLTKLNQFNGNYIQAEMVKAFLSSIEYRRRFGP